MSPSSEPAGTDVLADDLARLERLATGYRRVQDQLAQRAVREAARRDLSRKVVMVLALREFCPFARPIHERGREFDPKNWPKAARIPAQRRPPTRARSRT
ncbi:hypothetical protein [Pseudonocardia sp. NPDC049635]|uniref:hypothetical protein n=1 Tax=Pseudonocardia sp. NPDC049635 TaxID=3155506 RepID=UPI0033E66AE7